MAETTFRIVSEHHLNDDGDNIVLVACVKTGTERVHLSVWWSGYQGPLAKAGWDGPRDFELSPCNCDEYKETAPDWLQAAVKQYHREYKGERVSVVRPEDGKPRHSDWRKVIWQWVKKL